MNHEHEHEHDGVNGDQVNGSRPTEEELDAYQNQLTDEAIQDQVKVLKPLAKQLFAPYSYPDLLHRTRKTSPPLSRLRKVLSNHVKGC